MTRRCWPAVLLAAAIATACGGSATTTSPTTTTPVSTTELFVGTLSPGSETFYSFAVTSTGTVTVTLASTAITRIGPAVAVPLSVALGTPSGFWLFASVLGRSRTGTDGTTFLRQRNRGHLLRQRGGPGRAHGRHHLRHPHRAHLVMTLLRAIVLFLAAASAVGCSDGATATSPSATSTSPTTAIFASHLAQGGSASRAFSTTAAGIVQLTLTTFGSGGAAVGFGIGVPTTAAPCSLSQSVIAAAGTTAQIAVSADAGSYCVQLFDIGSITGDTPFSVTIEHP